jgi:hypothetical protein
MSSYKYNPTAQELRDAYLVAYGDLGDTMLIGALYGYAKTQNKDTIETVYAKALDKVRKDMNKLVKA